MSWLQPQFGRLVNLLATSRKPYLIPSGFFSPNQQTDFIWSPAGATSAIVVGASPFTHTAGYAQESVYISGGVVSNLTKNSVQLTSELPCTVVLQPGESFTITYSVAPTIVVST